MIFSMLVMLELCTRIKRENELTAKRRKFTGIVQLLDEDPGFDFINNLFMRKPGFPGYYYFGNVAGMSKPKIEEGGERGENGLF